MSSAALSMVFSALADPTRRAILQRLSRGEAPVKELVAPFALSGPAITKHLKVLERAGLISRSREGQQRPCRLEPHALEAAADFLEPYRAMWEEQLDRLDAHLKRVMQSKAALDAPKPEPAKRRATQPTASRSRSPQPRTAQPRTAQPRTAKTSTAKTKKKG